MDIRSFTVKSRSVDETMVSTARASLQRLMDYADSVNPGHCQLFGRFWSPDNEQLLFNPPNGQPKPEALVHAEKIAVDYFDLHNIDGVRCGTGLARLTPLRRCDFSILIIWSRKNRLRHTIRQLRPDRHVSLRTLIGAEWSSSSFIQIYKFKIAEDDENLKNIQVPDLSDISISSIPWLMDEDDESMPSILGPDPEQPGLQAPQPPALPPHPPDDMDQDATVVTGRNPASSTDADSQIVADDNSLNIPQLEQISRPITPPRRNQVARSRSRSHERTPGAPETIVVTPQPASASAAAASERSRSRSRDRDSTQPPATPAVVTPPTRPPGLSFTPPSGSSSSRSSVRLR